MLATVVSGTVSSDTVWSDTIHVVGDVTIEAGATLTIDSGTVIKSDHGRLVRALGAINAGMAGADPVIFTSVDDDSVGEDLTDGFDGIPVPGDWEAIYIDSSTVAFDNVEIR